MSAYKWNATDYEKNSQAQQKWARELIDEGKLGQALPEKITLQKNQNSAKNNHL